jgi:hypothetical protein
MKNITLSKKLIFTILAGLFGLIVLVACTTDSTASTLTTSVEPVQAAEAQSSEPESVIEANTIDEDNTSSIQAETSSSVNVPTVDGALSDAEVDGLIFMREEEKLARDVYLTLYDYWGLPLFQNISQAEQTHTDSVKTLLDNYGIEDPVVNDQIGVFTNQDLQSLYDQLIEQGSVSVSEALKVGAAIEEIDILDLEERLNQTDNADIQQVYNNLLSGSFNHLRAFVSNLERQTGETYVPQFMSQDAYDAIINSGMVGGQRGQGKGSGGNGGGRFGNGGRGQ